MNCAWCGAESDTVEEAHRHDCDEKPTIIEVLK